MNTALKILVLDDDKMFRALVPRWLSQYGFTNVCALGSCNEALERLAIDGDYHLVITDFNMPEMSGVDLIGKIRLLEHVEQPKVIVMSAGKNSEVALKGGADAFHYKLFSLERLTEAIKALFP